MVNSGNYEANIKLNNSLYCGAVLSGHRRRVNFACLKKSLVLKMTTTDWDKFKLLLWKNWIIQKRHYMQTIFEIMIPVLACSLLILVRGLVNPSTYKNSTTFDSLNVSSIASIRTMVTNHPIDLTLAFSPKNNLFEQVVKKAARMLGTDVKTKAFNDSKSMYNVLITNNYLAGIEFGDDLYNATSVPDNISIALRYPSEMRTTMLPGAEFWANWRTFLVFPPFQTYGARAINNSDGGYPANYYSESFVSVQNAVTRALLSAKNSFYQLPTVTLQRFPYPPFYNDPLLRGLENLFPVIIMIAFFYSCINTVKFITLEKERQLKESMKIMGLSGWIHWTAWFVKTLILLSISISLITILLCVSLTTNTDVAIFEFSNWFLVWVFLLMYSITTITFCFMLSSFFSKANIASGVSGIIWFYSLTPYNITFGNYDRMSLGSKLASSLWCNTAMGYGFMLLMKHEGTSAGLQWSNLFSPVTVDDQLTVAHILLMLLVDALFYLLVALYVEQVAPGKFGIPKKWNFIFTSDFWNMNNRYSKQTDSLNREHLNEGSTDNTEDEPTDKQAGVKILELSKVFEGSKGTKAVNGLSLNLYEDQISVLLGHNGAGKTTTMSMLTGMFPPTSGTAIVNGYDIRFDIQHIRNSIGLCPQHNVLFDELTVSEHIRFFSKLKGFEEDEIAGEIDKYLTLLELEDKRNAQSHTLSGGMKRKLSMAIALCGGSKVVLCDEPTSGMDPSARRLLWNVLQTEKIGRTILLSTHFMDEADILGDRVAIMAEGELKAVGSPFFLKQKYGRGYRLVCVKNPGCNSAILTNFLRKHIPDICVESDIGTELSYVLKHEYRQNYQSVLADLEEHSQKCEISSYGITLSTLEEIFMRLGSDGYLTSDTSNTRDIGYPNNSNALERQEHLYSSEIGRTLLFNHIKAMFLKKYLSFIRTWKVSSLQTTLSMFYIIVIIIIVRSFPNNVVLPPLEISFHSYEKTVTVLETTDTNGTLAKSYSHLFTGIPKTNKLITISSSFSDYILSKSFENIKTVDNIYMVGATLNEMEQSFTAWFNNKAYHTAPLSLNLIYNAMLQTFCSTCHVQIINKPLPYSSRVRFLRLQAGSNMGFQLAFNTGFAMAFVGAMYIMFYIKERASGAKLLQFVSGVNAITFWTVSFIWDYLVFLMAVLLYILTLAAFQEDGWSSPTELLRVVVVMLCFGCAVIPFTYLCSYFFDVPSTGFIKMLIFNIFTGTVIFTGIFLLKYSEFNLKDVAETMEWFYMIFPHFALSHSLNNINLALTIKQICDAQCEAMPFCTENLLCSFDKRCCDTEIFSFRSNGISRNLVYMLAVGFVSFAALLCKELVVINCKINFRKPWNCVPIASTSGSKQTIVLENDSDVLDEKQRVHSFSDTELDNHTLVVKDVSKYYGSFLAVNQMSLAVEDYECFGLLGVNGAGKTSTFKMLTGDETFSSGNAWVRGIDMRTKMDEVSRLIGYCPQFDALFEDLTGRETLTMFGLLRGVPNSSIKLVSLILANDLNFLQHIDKRVEAYSGGNKRKLSTALALIGKPILIFLDEPTTGMDPAARRHFWDTICRIRMAGKLIVMTSHSMEECEALCTRLAIMVNGEFKCLGSSQHLKNKFTKGFHLTIKLKKSDVSTSQDQMDMVKQYVEGNFEGACLREQYQDYLTYHLTKTSLKWSTMFGLMEKAMELFDIEDYALGQTSLEQVFLALTAYQRACD
ncbi:phospholipid-transporting ATPase ABCA3-like isoform X2 [Toxorhynchites rutilus septentrionalis]|uniref:phospholipid-transporting ATPase ABCA3-like isoform X2 n=1 Tax=Toxorhynchites rutilus septentrionalis TaxID=329112 RepID=UPI002479502C|nr:phospholipid-transporting ATPase ABCA3-like isoform X2 [Toxorhynchites rutilus septentrionalis]